jgi:S1-C subfamily serine protease
MNKFYFFLLSFFLSFFRVLSLSGSSLEDLKKSMVMINRSNVYNLYAYDNFYFCQGSGVIIDKKLGLILTNKHLSGGAGIFKYEICLCNGKKIKAEQVYYDKIYDIALLKVDPKEIEDLKELEISKKDSQISEKVFLISNNEGINFSYQEGTICSVSEMIYPSCCQILVTNINTKGGSSGAPVLNKDLEIIGLNFAGDDTYSLAIDKKYIENILKNFKDEKTNRRKTLGIYLTSNLNLSDAMKYLKFSKENCEFYMKKFPKSNGKIIAVYNVLKNFPSYGIIKENDILWEVNGKILGPEIKYFDDIVDSTKENESISLTVFRNGNFIKINVTAESLDKYTIKEIIDFAGGIFFQADETVNFRVGVERGKVLFKLKNEIGTPLNSSILKKLNGKTQIYCFELISIDGKKIDSIDDLKLILPRLKENKKFYIKYKILTPLLEDKTKEDEILSYNFSKPIFVSDIDISGFELNDKIITLDDNGIWNSKELK